MDNPRISVILPVYNGEKYLGECIRSVLNQTLTDFELLIGDDCSKDASSRIIDGFSDERIKYLYSGKNLGVAANLNRLISESRAPLLHILCQDDVLEKDCLKRETQFFEKHPDVSFAFCKARLIDRDGKEFVRAALNDLPEVIEPGFGAQLFLYFGCIPSSGSTICVRKTCFSEIGMFDETLRVAQDYDMWARIIERKKMGVIHDHLVCLRSHPGQQSRSHLYGPAYILETRQIRAFLLKVVPEEVRSPAKRYLMLRQNVLDTHYCLCCLIQGRFKDFFKIASIMGATDFTLGIIFWLLTLNNHIYRPEAKFFNIDSGAKASR